MKKILFSLFCSLSFCAFSEDPSTLGKIALSVVMPDNIEGLNDNNISKLETKLHDLITRSGLSTSGYNNNFIIYPVFQIYESNTVSGLRKITFLSCEITFFIRQVDNKMVFSTLTKTYTGNGSSKQYAIMDAIQSIKTSDPDFTTFIEKGKQKIIDYYEVKCQDLILKAETLAKKNEFQESLALLLSIPEEVSCYSKACSKVAEVFVKYQGYTCQSNVQKARTLIAGGDYQTALDILSNVHPSSKCSRAAETLIKNTAARIDEENRKSWELAMKVYEDYVKLENKRIDNEAALQKQIIGAARDVAVAYYQQQPTPINISYNKILLW